MHRHFTATALVIDEKRHRTLLLWHKRLRRWMPPGGHMEPNETPEDTALREAKEETGLDIEILGEKQEDFYHDTGYEGRILKKPFAFFLERIPPCPERNEPEHEHIDFVFRARARDPEQVLTLCAAESDHLRWFTREEIAALDTSYEIYANVQNLLLSLLPTALAGSSARPALAGAHRRDHCQCISLSSTDAKCMPTAHQTTQAHHRNPSPPSPQTRPCPTPPLYGGRGGRARACGTPAGGSSPVRDA